jgi:hypothetical protein
MARPPRLERGPPGLEGGCSIHLSYGRRSRMTRPATAGCDVDCDATPFENGDLPITMMIHDHYLCAGKSLIPRIFIIVRGV